MVAIRQAGLYTVINAAGHGNCAAERLAGEAVAGQQIVNRDG